MKKADIGLIGLAVMGENLALNMESKGFTVAVYNRSFPGEEGVVDRFVNGRGKGKNFIPAHSIEELVEAVKRPRVIMMMIKAGAPVDEMIEQLLPHMSPGDVIIDGGNSDFHDTERRVKEVEAKGLYFVGSGISGGEEGALHGPSVMPGGSPEAWPIVKDILQGIAAKLDDGTPCCQWIGTGGAGHFVKMVHNGIEYGDMQLISEAYSLLKNRKGLDDDEMAVVFEEWNKGELDSFLIEITKNILRFRDEDGKPLLDKILDVAGQKGTGKWSAIAAMDENDPLTLITEAVYARMLSALSSEREKASGLYPEPVELGENLYVEEIRQALYAAKLISYAQGFSLIRRASERYGWNLDFGTIAQIPGIYFATFLRNASIVFSIRQAIVIGPTPPGTFVISEAFGSQASKSTSPHNFPVSGSRLTPTSITTAPSPTMSAVTNFGRPIATTRISASRVTSARFFVRL